MQNDIDDDLNEFVIHRATTHGKNQSPHAQVLSLCKKKQDQLMTYRLDKVVGEMLTVCEQNYSKDNNGGLIFPVHFLKNQEQDLPQFVDLFVDEMENNSWIKKDYRYHVARLKDCQIRDLVLNMYIFLQQNPQFEIVVFIPEFITDLSENNIYCFQKGLKSKRYIAVLPTFEKFDNEEHNNTQVLSYQKYHLSLYNPKQLFCDFMYQCIIDQKIKAYLPSQILFLISDIDYYSISYKESCRRFLYCFERALYLSKKQKVYVEFDALVQTIEEVINKQFKIFYNYKKGQQKILKIVLHEKERYTISEKYLTLQLAFSIKEDPNFEQKNLISNIRQSLTRKFQKSPHLSQYAAILNETDQKGPEIKKNKKNRSDLLGIDTKKNITPKNELENQITKIVKNATHLIRKQAAEVQWSDIHYQLRIKPAIPYLTIKSLQKWDIMDGILNIILENYSLPLAKLLALYPEDNGHTIYLLRVLQLNGVIDISKKTHRPIVYNNFYEKCKFSGQYH